MESAPFPSDGDGADTRSCCRPCACAMPSTAHDPSQGDEGDRERRTFADLLREFARFLSLMARRKQVPVVQPRRPRSCVGVLEASAGDAGRRSARRISGGITRWRPALWPSMPRFASRPIAAGRITRARRQDVFDLCSRRGASSGRTPIRRCGGCRTTSPSCTGSSAAAATSRPRVDRSRTADGFSDARLAAGARIEAAAGALSGAASARLLVGLCEPAVIEGRRRRLARGRR